MFRKGWIYEIRNIITNKVYIGSTVDFKQRKRNHVNKLRNKTHRNQYLIRAWHKYGEENFVFNILEFFENITHEKLRAIEQTYLDTIKNKYNTSKRADCPYLGENHFKKLHKASRKACTLKWEITDPNGISFCLLTGLKTFCIENNLSLTSMHKVAQGKRSHHKKWKCAYVDLSKRQNFKKYHNKYRLFLYDKDYGVFEGITSILIFLNISKSSFYKYYKAVRIFS